MSFRLTTDNRVDDFSDRASFRFNEAGLLVIDDGDGERTIYGPGTWYSVTTTTPDTPDTGIRVLH